MNEDEEGSEWGPGH